MNLDIPALLKFLQQTSGPYINKVKQKIKKGNFVFLHF